MSELLRLEPLEVVQSELLVPDQRSVVYPGQDAWLQIQRGVTDPGSNPAWAMVQKTPDTPGTPAIPGKALATTGTPAVISSAQSKFGQSLDCGGSASAFSSPAHADWNFAGGDFTLDGWFYHRSTQRKAFFALQGTDQSDRGFEWTMDVMPAGTPGFTFYYNNVTTNTAWDFQYDQGFVATLGQWYHYAIVRVGTVLRTFVNGVQQGADWSIGSTVIRTSNAPLRVLGDARTTGNDFNGYCDELRISKGIARWTSNFTPPTSPYTKDAYTVFLAHWNGLDGSTPTTDDTGTPAGPSTPFDPGSNPAWLHVES